MNAYQVVKDFEKALCDYTESPYCVAVESCSAAIFLSLMRRDVRGMRITIPKITYPSVANAIIHAGARIRFCDNDWQSARIPVYELSPCLIYDAAKVMYRGMAKGNKMLPSFICLSFHAHKALPIGRGGAILCSREDDYEWFRCARFDGRHEKALPEDELAFPGWNMYMAPEQASRGLELMQWLPDEVICPPDPYQDLSKYEFYK